MKAIKMFMTLFSVIAIFLLAACNGTEEKTAEMQDSKKTEEKSYTINHAMGSTTIKGTPKRVVILTIT